MRNLGTLDRIVRTVLGVLLLPAPWLLPAAWLGPFTAGGSWALTLPIAGAALIANAAMGICLGYTLLGIRTCPVPSRGR